MTLGFYRAFEDLHRGPREEIQARHAVYLPFVKAVCAAHPGAPVTDLGCGRGEWIELLVREGIAARGVDSDEGMLEACRSAGLDVRLGDALDYLCSLATDSQAVVSAFHVAEHLPFDVLERLVKESLRVLRPGGLLILETPNPENLAVGTSGFYMDPTHVRPLPAALLSFLVAHQGFARSKELRLHEKRPADSRDPVSMIDILAGVSPDYAVVAQKAGAPAPGESAELDAAFARDYGVSLTDLSLQHDRQNASRAHEALSLAAQARDTANAARDIVGKLEASLTDKLALLDTAVRRDQLELRNHVDALAALVREQAHTMEMQAAELLQSHARLQLVYESTSWRITAPVRWFGHQAAALRREGARTRLRKAMRLVSSGNPASPGEPPPPPVPTPTPPPHPDLSPEARRVLDGMESAPASQPAPSKD